MNKQQLASKIWESANKMRSKIEANEYKDYILGFIFYKYLSEHEVQYMLDKDATKDILSEFLIEDNTGIVENCQDNLGYFISYDNLFSTWIENGNDFDISDVRDALSAFSRLVQKDYEHLFKDIFETLETGLSKLGSNSKNQTKAAKDLIHLIAEIPMDGKQGYDVLGYIYEYLIQQFAANAGKKAGEFYTPHEVSCLMSEIVAHHLQDKEEIQIYDPTSGSGSLLINIGNSVAKYNNNKDQIVYYAQELKKNTYNLTRMNLIMRGILPDNIVTRNNDTLDDDWPVRSVEGAEYEPLLVDAVVSNPPYSQKWDPEGKDSDSRFNKYGIAPKGKADYAFLLHDLYHTRQDGIVTIVLPHGVLFRGNDEGEIRKNLIENHNIDAVIGLPANIFFGTGIPTIILVLKKQRIESDVLFIDASKGFAKKGKQNVLRSSDIKKIVDTIIQRNDSEKYSRLVSIDEIRDNDYNLNIPRYVDSSKDAESWDIYASMFGGIPKNELEDLDEYWEVFPNLFNDLFKQNTPTNYSLATDDIKAAVETHEDVLRFKSEYRNAFEGFDSLLKERLTSNPEKVSIGTEENTLSAEIFNRVENIPLINPYKAYQILDDCWKTISVDLEIIKTEGFEAAKKIDPILITKKVKGVDQEVQDGWKGHVIPFDIVQKNLLKSDLDKLTDEQNRLSEAVSRKDEIIESLSEEDKAELSEELNNDDTKFLAGPTKKLAKQLEKEMPIDGYPEDSLESYVIEAKDLMELETKLKKVVKNDSKSLETATMTALENIDDVTLRELLGEKWIKSLLENLEKMPDDIIDNLVSKIEYLDEKYAETLADIDQQITDTENELISMIDQLVGSEEDMLGLKAFKSLLGGE